MRRRKRSSVGGRLMLALGFLLHLAVGVWVSFSGLLMPLVAVAALVVVWAISFVLAIRWRDTPALVLVLPVGVLAIWFVTAWIGDTFFGWTA